MFNCVKAALKYTTPLSFAVHLGSQFLRAFFSLWRLIRAICREGYGDRSKRNWSLAPTKRNWPSFVAFYPPLICLIPSLSVSPTLSCFSHSLSSRSLLVPLAHRRLPVFPASPRSPRSTTRHPPRSFNLYWKSSWPNTQIRARCAATSPFISAGAV